MISFKLEKKFTVATLLLAFSFMGAYPFFTGNSGTITWSVFYYGRFVFLLLAVFYIHSINRRQATKVVSTMLEKSLLKYEMCIFIYSIIIWIVCNVKIPYITRGISDILFNVGAYVIGVELASYFGNKVLKIGLSAAFITFFLSILIGIFELKGKFIPLMLKGNNYYLELSEVLFTIGLYILCILYSDKQISNKSNKLTMVIAIILFIIGGKRIGLAGLILVSVFLIVTRKLSIRAKKFVIKLTGMIVFFIVLLYVYVVISGKFRILMANYGIDLMGRDVIYNYFSKLCTFNLSFIGRGAGFVGRTFSYTSTTELYNMASVKALHNDFLKNYIELGFIGFLLWNYYWLRHIPKQLTRKIGIENTLICFSLILYSFITYATDNTAGYFNYQMHLVMLISAVSSGYLQLKKGGGEYGG